MHSAAMPLAHEMPRACRLSWSPGGCPATFTGAAGTSSAKRSRKKRAPYDSSGRPGRYSFGASNEPPGEVSKIAYQSWTPCRARLSARPSANASTNKNAANAGGERSARAARGAASAPAASVQAETAASGDTRGSQAMTNGGSAVPSLPVAALIDSPATTVAAAPKVTIRETSHAGGEKPPTGWDARCMTARMGLGALLLAAAVAGCGSESVHELPPAAEPPQSPPITAQPAGRVTPVGSQPEGVAAAGGRVAVGLRGPGVLAVVGGGGGPRGRRGPPPH